MGVSEHLPRSVTGLLTCPYCKINVARRLQKHPLYLDRVDPRLLARYWSYLSRQLWCFVHTYSFPLNQKNSAVYARLLYTTCYVVDRIRSSLTTYPRFFGAWVKVPKTSSPRTPKNSDEDFNAAGVPKEGEMQSVVEEKEVPVEVRPSLASRSSCIAQLTSVILSG